MQTTKQTYFKNLLEEINKVSLLNQAMDCIDQNIMMNPDYASILIDLNKYSYYQIQPLNMSDQFVGTGSILKELTRLQLIHQYEDSDHTRYKLTRLGKLFDDKALASKKKCKIESQHIILHQYLHGIGLILTLIALIGIVVPPYDPMQMFSSIIIDAIGIGVATLIDTINAPNTTGVNPYNKKKCNKLINNNDNFNKVHFLLFMIKHHLYKDKNPYVTINEQITSGNMFKKPKLY